MKTDDVVLVSESLLETDAGVMLLELYLGMCIYPDAYGDLIEQGGIDFVYQDILGTPPDGIYFYPTV